MKFNHFSHFLSPIILVLLFSSCGGVKHAQLTMFEKVGNDQFPLGRIPALSIRPDDILSVQVASRNPERVAAFRRSYENAANSGAEAFSELAEGYRVNEQGNIYLPFLGQVKASGKTVVDLRQEITDRLAEFIPDAAVQVRFLNFRVTLLGEVNQPNTYTIPNERLTILEAIGLAGDFTPYARRNSLLIIRERNEKREFARLDFQNKNLFMSPFFYLSPNDIVYVEPLKAKQYATQGDFFQRYSSVFVPVVSVVTYLVGALLFR
jgi:polysaccharide biosynthesis/export protein